jgi:hypothetical protein
MPHKTYAARRHRIPRPARQVLNWRDYDTALRQRGSLTVWFTAGAIEKGQIGRWKQVLGGWQAATATA